jgi:hypothetical protein
MFGKHHDKHNDNVVGTGEVQTHEKHGILGGLVGGHKHHNHHHHDQNVVGTGVPMAAGTGAGLVGDNLVNQSTSSYASSDSSRSGMGTGIGAGTGAGIGAGVPMSTSVNIPHGHTETYTERAAVHRPPIVLHKEEVTVYEATRHDERAVMEGGEKLTNPQQTVMQPVAAVAEVPVVTDTNMSAFDASIAPVAAEAITHHGQGPLATGNFTNRY